MKSMSALLALTFCLSLVPQVQAAEPGEYLQDTMLLPVRTAAIVSALAVTTPVRTVQGAIDSARTNMPNQSPDTLIFEYAAVPLGMAAGAINSSLDGAGKTINKAWDKPFSMESFDISDSTK